MTFFRQSDALAAAALGLFLMSPSVCFADGNGESNNTDLVPSGEALDESGAAADDPEWVPPGKWQVT